jgi:maleate cis-trans isomerase
MPKPAGLEYATRGLVGVLVPPGNPTVEPETALLLPPGIGAMTARLIGQAGASMDLRLQQYLLALDETLAQFNTAPIDAFMMSVTGSSYFVGAAAEDALVAKLEAARGVPFITAARSVRDSLAALGAKRIGLVSPYPDVVTEASAAYWTSRGFEVVRISRTVGAAEGYHSIYVLGTAQALQALEALDPAGLDAVVLLGTGMPTLGAIKARPRHGSAPVISSMLCVAWATVEALAHAGQPGAGDRLRRWIAAEHWGAAHAARLGAR